MAGLFQEHPPRPAPGGGLLPKRDALPPDGEVSGPRRGAGGWRRHPEPVSAPGAWVRAKYPPALRWEVGLDLLRTSKRQKPSRGQGWGEAGARPATWLEIRCVTVHKSRHHHRPGIQLIWQPPASLTGHSLDGAGGKFFTSEGIPAMVHGCEVRAAPREDYCEITSKPSSCPAGCVFQSLV